VIRDGRVCAILEGATLTEEGIAQQLVVSRGAAAAAKTSAALDHDRRTLLTVRNWSHRAAFHNITLEAKPGEIVALVGVEGSGARELLRSFAGLEPCSGEIDIAGETGDNAQRLSAYVPATRMLSLYSNFSVEENLLVRPGSPEIARLAMALRKKRMRRLASNAMRRFSIRAHSVAQSIRSLSGGNQQKTAIAQALNCGPRLLLLEEPTRGLDIQSKREIYRLLRKYVSANNAVVMFCTEVLEVHEAADRAHVVVDGRVSQAIVVGEYPHVEALATDVAHGASRSR
jgi:ABC-type sugar transport system ATPase subunit